MVMRILVKAASPAHTNLFLAYFNERERFSEMHLYYYKKLLDVVGKTQAPQLVEPLIDLLRRRRGRPSVFLLCNLSSWRCVAVWEALQRLVLGGACGADR